MSTKTLKELLDERTAKRSAADVHIKLGETEKRDLTDAEGSQVDKLLDEIDALNPLIEQKQRAQARREQGSVPRGASALWKPPNSDGRLIGHRIYLEHPSSGELVRCILVAQSRAARFVAESGDGAKQCR